MVFFINYKLTVEIGNEQWVMLDLVPSILPADKIFTFPIYF